MSVLLIVVPLKSFQCFGEISSGGFGNFLILLTAEHKSGPCKAPRRGGGRCDERSLLRWHRRHVSSPNKPTTQTCTFVFRKRCSAKPHLPPSPIASPSISDSKQPALCLLACVYARVCSHWELLRSPLLLLEPCDYAWRLFIYLFSLGRAKKKKKGCLNINRKTRPGLIRLEDSVEGRSLSGLMQHQNHAGRKRGRRRREIGREKGELSGGRGWDCFKSSHLQRLFSE